MHLVQVITNTEFSKGSYFSITRLAYNLQKKSYNYLVNYRKKLAEPLYYRKNNEIKLEELRIPHEV